MPHRLAWDRIRNSMVRAKYFWRSNALQTTPHEAVNSFQKPNCSLRAVFHDLATPFEKVPTLVTLPDKYVLLSSSALHNLIALCRSRASGRCSVHLEPWRRCNSLMAHKVTPASHPHQDTKRKNNTNQRKPLLNISSCHPLAKPLTMPTSLSTFHWRLLETYTKVRNEIISQMTKLQHSGRRNQI